MSDPIIGIDLGTSNCCVAVTDEAGKVAVLPDAQSRKVIPSVLSFHPQGNVLIGHEAKQRRVIDPRHTVFSWKRIMGRRFGSFEVTQAALRSSFTIKQGANEQPVVSVRAGDFSIPELSAILLDHMRSIAATKMGKEIKRAVVTVPANFNDAQRQATALAGEIAELVVVRILNEPTAAALAYGHGRGLSQTVAVYDFGGGTFDVTLLALRDNIYEVLSTAGDTFLGGDDIDERLVDYMVEMFLQQHRFDLRTDDLAVQRLRAVAEQVKCELSAKPRAMVTIQELAVGVGGQPLDLTFTLTREEFVKRIADLVDKSFPVVDEAFKLAGLSASQIDEVVLVGGTTRIPYLREKVSKHFNRTPRTDVNPDEAVALGAALQGHALMQVLDKPAQPRKRSTTQTGAAVPPPAQRGAAPPPIPALPPAIGKIPLAKAAVPNPVRTTTPQFREVQAVVEHREFGTDEETGAGTNEVTFTRSSAEVATQVAADMSAEAESSTTVGDEPLELMSGVMELPNTPLPAPKPTMQGTPRGPAPAAPAPIDYSQVLTPPPPRSQPMPSIPPPMRPVLLDVTPRALCVATVGGYCDEIIRRNAQIPIEQTRVFTTAQEGQSSVEIKIGQGESRRFDENILLGSLVLDGLESRPRGALRIAVTFEVDTDGMLQVSAVDELTRKQQSARIHLLGVIGGEDVEAAKEKIRDLRAR